MNKVTNTATTGSAQPEVSQPAPAPLVQISPHELVIEENIRDGALSRSFLASIRRHGVLVPVLAYTDDGGRIVVRDGRRRVLAARETERDTIPAYVVEADKRTRQRIIEQYVTNQERQGLTDAEKTAAFHQLSLEGMSVAAIARSTGAGRKVVQTSLTVAEDQTATEAMTHDALTLEQAVVLAEFADEPEQVNDLRSTAARHPEAFAHHAQRLRDERARCDEAAALRADYEGKGFAVIDWPGPDERDTVARLAELQTQDGLPVTEEDWAGKPGHAVAIGQRWGYGPARAEHVIVDWRKHGLRKIGSRITGKLTEEEKAARREVIANNKAWESAETVRREWLATLLRRKRLPTDALTVAATILTADTIAVSRAASTGHPMAAELMGAQDGASPKRVLEKTPTRAGHVLLALALGAIEGRTSRDTWRRPEEADRRYFRRLEAWGYALSDVEQIVANGLEDDSGDAAEPDAADEQEQHHGPAPADAPPETTPEPDAADSDAVGNA